MFYETIDYYFQQQCQQKFLNEAYHIWFSFNDCIQDIIKNIEKFSSTFSYTGWNYFNKTNTCEYKNSLKEGYPIYVKLLNSDQMPYTTSIKDRTRKLHNIVNLQNKIYITINSDKIDDEMNLIADLSHEFRHCLDMYINPNKNNIENDQAFSIKLDKDLKNIISEIDFNKIKIIMQMFSLSEETPRLHGAISYLKQFSEEEIKQIFNENAKTIKKTYQIIYSDKIENKLWLQQMTIEFGKLNDELMDEQYKFLFQLAYFYFNYSGDNSIKISKDDVKNFDNLDKIKIKNVCISVCAALRKNLFEFNEKAVKEIATFFTIK